MEALAVRSGAVVHLAVPPGREEDVGCVSRWEASGIPVRVSVLPADDAGGVCTYAASAHVELVVVPAGGGGVEPGGGLPHPGGPPVLYLRDGVSRDALFGHVLVVLDGTRTGERVLPWATGLGRLGDARYTLLEVVRPGYLIGTGPSGVKVDWAGVTRSHGEAARYVADVAERLRGRGFRVDCRTLVRARDAAGILAVARAEGADLVALACDRGARGRDAARTLLAARGPALLLYRCRPSVKRRSLPPKPPEA